MITAIVGGRPGMISAATAATAVLMVTLVKEHGLEYLLAATVLAGLIQIAAGIARLGYVMRFVSKSVMTGFVNALAILIFMAQLPELTNVTWHVYAMTAAGLGIIYLFPLLPVIVQGDPLPLICIVVLTGVALLIGLDIRTVGDMGQLPGYAADLSLAGCPSQSRHPDDCAALLCFIGGGGPAGIDDDCHHCGRPH